jgi:ATP-dependent helicase/nuclease subunit B
MVDFSYKDIDQESLEKEIRKAFKLDGIVVDDPLVIESIAGKFSGYSTIIPVQNTKDGMKSAGKSGDTGLMTESEFRELQDCVATIVKDSCADLLKGKIDIHPMKTKERSACTYCQYKGICRFDTVFEGCSYNIVN